MRSRRAVSTVPGLALLSALALAIPDGARGETTPLSPQAQEALIAYLRDPAGNAKVFLDAARQENGTLDPVQAVFLGDAALRIGRYRMAAELFQAARDSGDPKFEGAAEIGLAWAALGRGHLDDAYKHLESAGELNPAFRSFTDVTMALVAAADGDPDGRAALAAAAARPDVDPGFREVAPLLDAYARYWAGDADGAAAAFTAFAVAHPDSRFADDAVYAAAQAKQLAGREAEAQADLEALAGDSRGHGPLSSRLVALDGRSLLREGMRRDRGLGTRLLPQRIADLLDGNGVRMARAALAARARESAAAATDAGATPRTARRRKAVRGSETPGEGGTQAPGYGGSEGTRASAPAVTSSPSAPPEHPARFPWTAVLAVGALLLGLGLWLFGRGRTAQAGSR
jgi:hypothetical protein